MIINLHFGYTSRHHIYYDTERKRGTLKLCSSYNSPVTSSGRSERQQVSASKPMIQPETLAETLFRENQQTEFSIADEPDLVSMLAALMAVKNGRESTFTSKEGRKIVLSLKKQGKSKKDVIDVAIQYGKAAKLTMGEAHKLHTIVMDILHDLGYSAEVISKKLKSIP